MSDVPGYGYRWVNGIPGHMHVISGGVDLHLAFGDSRVIQDRTVKPDPDNGFQGFVWLTQELEPREPHFGLYATTVESPYDEYHVRDLTGRYVGRLNRGRNGLYTASVKDHSVDPRNQDFKTVLEALEYVSGVLETPSDPPRTKTPGGSRYTKENK